VDGMLHGILSTFFAVYLLNDNMSVISKHTCKTQTTRIGQGINQIIMSGKLYTDTRPKCKEEKTKEEEIKKKRKLESIKYSTELNCNNCYKTICFVDAYDLEGSKFYCNNCKHNINVVPQSGTD
jgi:hypothetical protein